MKVSGKVIVVTGGGSGIGREIVLNLLSKGAKVAAVDLNKEGLEETKKIAGEKGENLSLHVANITNRERVEQLPEEIFKEHETFLVWVDLLQYRDNQSMVHQKQQLN